MAGGRTIPGLEASGVRPDDLIADEIRGSTTILELLRMFPDGRAARLMSEIQFPCAHCGGAVREPLTMAAKRHKRDPRAVLDAFRALRDGFPDDELVASARTRAQMPAAKRPVREADQRKGSGAPRSGMSAKRTSGGGLGKPGGSPSSSRAETGRFPQQIAGAGLRQDPGRRFARRGQTPFGDLSP
jgi:hypothetical protein